MSPKKDEPEEPPREWKKKVYKGHSKTRSSKDRFVIRNEKRGGWDVVKEDHERSSGHFKTQEEAIERAREIVEKLGHGKGEIRIRGHNGNQQDRTSRNPPDAHDDKG